jgi:hypothetical protein
MPHQHHNTTFYIERLSERGLPPTRETVRDFGSTVAQEEVSEAWVTRFLKRNQVNLTSKWTTEMDCNRHVVDSEERHCKYFELLHGKICQYNIGAENIYNMDQKGLLVGIIGCSKRIFPKAVWERKEKTRALQDGSREWITLIAAVCADRNVLPPALIFQGKKRLQSTWVANIEAGKHSVFLGKCKRLYLYWPQWAHFGS